MRQIVTRYAKLRDQILARIREVNTTTEEGVLQAGTQLQKVVDTAKEHISALRDLLLSATTGGALQRAITVHADHAKRHARALDIAVAGHAAEVIRLGELSREIRAAAVEIDRANKAARVLSLNARIEASRGGAAAFNTVAVEMGELSRVIIGANGRVQRSAAELDAAVPRLVAQAQALRELVAAFASSTNEQLDAIESEGGTLASAASAALASSDEALQKIVSSAYGGLSALQFQDVCRQSLLQIDQWEVIALRETATDLHVEHDVPPSDAAASTASDIMSVQATRGDVLFF